MIKRYIFALLVYFALMSFVLSPAYSFEGYGWIGGTSDDAPYDLAYDCGGEGWKWSTDEAKLTLYEGYSSSIFIECYEISPVNLEIAGNVNIHDEKCGSAICVNGVLNISGTGTLTVNPSKLAAESYSLPTIRADEITFSGAKVIVSSDRELNRTITAEQGSVNFTGDSEVIVYSRGMRAYTIYANDGVIINQSAKLRSESYGEDGAGILITEGNLVVKDSAELRVSAREAGYAVEITNGSADIANSANVILNADNPLRELYTPSNYVMPSIITSSLPSGTAGEFYSVVLSAEGTAPFSWAIESGDLPVGLELERDSGTISGIPEEAGTSYFTVMAMNLSGYSTRDFEITIDSSRSSSIGVSGSGGGCGLGWSGILLVALCVMVLRKN